MAEWMDSNHLRKTFLEFFMIEDHEVVPSSSLIPTNDPTLLFTNAGMVQFKEVFLGIEKRPYMRATSAQRCVRAGGKHNDLENVGYTKRHHTFFEMLGNFSFGDYFKKEAIEFAWRFLTEVLKLPKEKLWVTVYRDDKESEDIWLNDIKVDPLLFARCGEADNFWSMGDTGPCGPCTEIFYDHGPEVEGGAPGSADQHGDRYVEIWNLVFMQYDRNMEGELSPLPKPCVDTGMGLERLAAVMQGVHDNYDIDIFQQLLQSLSTLVNCDDFSDTSMRVIVDHIRSVAFLIMDGVTPSNEGRGYVLRRIIRRAIRHGYKLGQKDPFFYKLTSPLAKVMGDAYPQLRKAQTLIERILEQEEIQFANTLSRGLKIFDQETAELKGKQIPGQTVFQLYDTYGFPPDLTADIARERGLTVDYLGFESAMAKQREQSQQASQFNVDYTEQLHIFGQTEFIGYENLSGESVVTTLLQDNKPVAKLDAGQIGVVVLNRTPFYAESGGQVGDTGYLYFESGNFRVADTQSKGPAVLHYGELVKGQLHVKDKVGAEVDPSRQAVVLNHSATHLLHEALRRVLGEHVTQKGSLVEAKRLRFDFSHPGALTEVQIQAVERLVNQQIRANFPTTKKVTSLDEAKSSGAMALFGEKYGDEVRVVSMGDFSTEICAGTHVARTGDIGIFKITSETACAAGIRRIEAVTGDEALLWIERGEEQLNALSTIFKSNREKVLEKVNQALEQGRSFSKEATRLKRQLAHQQSGALSEEAKDIEGIKVLALQLDSVDRETLRNTLDQLKQEFDTYAIVLATVRDQTVQLVAGVSKNCLKNFNATELLNCVAYRVGGKGGGRPDLAQGGGDKPEALESALGAVIDWVKQKLIK